MIVSHNRDVFRNEIAFFTSWHMISCSRMNLTLSTHDSHIPRREIGTGPSTVERLWNGQALPHTDWLFDLKSNRGDGKTVKWNCVDGKYCLECVGNSIVSSMESVIG